MVFGDLTGRLKGLPYVLIGAGIVYASDLLPEDYRKVGKAVGIGVIGYGAYQILVKPPEEEEYIPPSPGVHELKATITDPVEGEDWSCMRPHDIDATIYNPYNVPFKVYAYCMAYHEDTETLYTINSPKEVKLNPYDEEKVSFYVKWDCIHHRGKWRTWVLLLSQPDLEHLRYYFVGASNIVHFTVSFK